MYIMHAEVQMHAGRLEEFKGACPGAFKHCPEYGMRLYGAWESIIGPRHLIIDVWQYDSREAMVKAFAGLAEIPAWQKLYAIAFPTMVTEDIKNVEPMPYCQKFRKLKTRAILYWKMRTIRERFEDFVEVRQQFIPMAEKHGWVLAAAWTNGFDGGPQNECTEAWFFEDQNKLMELMARVEQDEKVQKVLGRASALLIEDATKLMRPTFYSPDYLP